MKALSLWQPWATLVALGAKQVETRAWPVPPSILGERIAIHASQTTKHLDLRHANLFAGALRDVDQLPLGALLCTLVIDDCRRIGISLEGLSPTEYVFGDYSVGRYAWRLRDVVALPEPVPCRGRQRFWNVPDPRPEAAR